MAARRASSSPNSASVLARLLRQPTSAASASHRSRAAPPGGGASGRQPTASSAATTLSRSGAVLLGPGAARSAAIAWRTSARSKNRSRPCTTYGTPASASASSYAWDCALVRNSTAISRAGCGADQLRAPVATAAASVGSSAWERITGSGPGGR